VLIVPGAHFGLDGTFRIGFGYEAEKLPEGLASVAARLDAAARATGRHGATAAAGTES
jgi:hypothetical protein